MALSIFRRLHNTKVDPGWKLVVGQPASEMGDSRRLCCENIRQLGNSQRCALTIWRRIVQGTTVRVDHHELSDGSKLPEPRKCEINCWTFNSSYRPNPRPSQLAAKPPMSLKCFDANRDSSSFFHAVLRQPCPSKTKNLWSKGTRRTVEKKIEFSSYDNLITSIFY